MTITRLSFLLALTITAQFGCGDSDASTGGGGEGGEGQGGSGGAPPVEPVCTEPEAVPCEDDVVLQMNLRPDPAPGGIQNESQGAGFVSVIDATAGGPFTTTPDSYTYGRFTAQGLEKVAISDEDSLASMEWDIAFRRYVGRINSGHSGPSCVSAARVPGAADFDGLSEVPAGLTFREDQYFTDTCELIADGTGLPGSPATALSSYWEYPGCVEMTGNVYVVRLADGRHVKLTVTHFYNDAAQEQCQESGTVPMNNNGSGSIRIRWAFLP